MSNDRSEGAIVVLVLLAAAGVLLAPILGRTGAGGLANVVMLAAAGCGLAAFGTAGAVTLRAARSPRRSRPPEEEG